MTRSAVDWRKCFGYYPLHPTFEKAVTGEKKKENGAPRKENYNLNIS